MQKQIILFVLLVLALQHNAMAGFSSPSGQPLTGPGGNDYRHQEVTRNGPYWIGEIERRKSQASYKYIIFTPATPLPEEAPVVLFIHGWGAMTPETYQAWIDHMVKKGYIVVWVQFQRDDLHEAPIATFPWLYAKRIISLWQDALARLDANEFLIRPAKDEKGMIKTAMMGHSAGGYMAVAVAAKATWKWKYLPVPYAVVAVEPGLMGLFAQAPFNKMDLNTKIIIVVGDEDEILCKSSAQRLWKSIPQIPDANKELLLVKSDYHGKPEQIANHFFSATTGARDTAAVDARDFYVTFKLSVGALNCAFRGTDCEIAFGNGSEEQLYMGEWNDGQPITPMIWVQDPESLETTCDDPGLKGILE